MKRGLTHDEALDAVVAAMSVSVLSYQEAIESYLMLRRLESLFTSQAAEGFHEPLVRDASASEAFGRDAEERLDAEHEQATAQPGRPQTTGEQ